MLAMAIARCGSLAAVVITAALGLFEVAGVRRLWAMRRSEFALSMACFLGVAVFGVLEGIFIAVGLALANFIQRAWRPYDAVLGRVDGMKGYPVSYTHLTLPTKA